MIEREVVVELLDRDAEPRRDLGLARRPGARRSTGRSRGSAGSRAGARSRLTRRRPGVATRRARRRRRRATSGGSRISRVLEEAEHEVERRRGTRRHGSSRACAPSGASRRPSPPGRRLARTRPRGRGRPRTPHVGRRVRRRRATAGPRCRSSARKSAGTSNAPAAPSLDVAVDAVGAERADVVARRGRSRRRTSARASTRAPTARAGARPPAVREAHDGRWRGRPRTAVRARRRSAARRSAPRRSPRCRRAS